MNISRDIVAYNPTLQWQPVSQQPPIQGKHHETSSHLEYLTFKKQRICEKFVPNPRIPEAMKEVDCSGTKASKGHCRMFRAGRKCSYGDMCRFLHVIPDKIRDISMIGIVPSAALMNQKEGSDEVDSKGFTGSLSGKVDGNLKKVLWKTKLCNNWKMTGSCRYGKACCFAHGSSELQNIDAHFALEPGIVPTRALKNDHNDRNETQNYFMHETKGLLKRKRTVKLCDIYADWIENRAINSA